MELGLNWPGAVETESELPHLLRQQLGRNSTFIFMQDDHCFCQVRERAVDFAGCQAVRGGAHGQPTLSPTSLRKRKERNDVEVPHSLMRCRYRMDGLDGD